ncbi:acyl-CoA dehydrogenase family protein [Chelatococcus reniformis]|uniref:Acyl-CoA dehydrogenase short-chain specific n=1 Tax=Chelatococcus reniformis TaxID=1494448 RepID=A0A916UVV1_9HYPH|nr:acyl-CoA dehydrogenase family protein [Chelatococcus reniformis]GGC89250.1 acyl-CoA dehydrogenase short-chain specific [Chelatococcus reniformis]
MDFSFTEEQVMLRDSVARYLGKAYDFDARQALLRSGAPWSKEAWRQFADLGVLALPLPEEVGGLGGSAADLVPVAETFGEHLTVEPWAFALTLAGGALVAAGDNAAARRHLADLASGASTGAFAYDEGRGLAAPAQIAMTAAPSGGGFVLDGEKRLVFGAAEAGFLVVAARAAGRAGDVEGLVLLLVDPHAPGVALTPFRTQDGRSAAHVRFDDVAVAGADVLMRDAHGVIAKLISDAILVLAAEAVGAMGALLRITGTYATTRKQFGVAIGTFQAVAHRLADMKIAHAKAYASLMYSTALAEAGRLTARDVSVLKGQVGKLGRTIAEAAVQTHGGVGMTDELSVGHYMKRLLAFEVLFGAPDYHFRLVGKAA